MSRATLLLWRRYDFFVTFSLLFLSLLPNIVKMKKSGLACFDSSLVLALWRDIFQDNRMLGMGSGQPNRVKSLLIALEKAGEEAKGAALASDAFFPFAWNDAVEDACKAGVKVIAQPGGSMRDQDAIDCCNKYGVAMLFTEVRHFRH
jgi:hypothetical protein